MTHDLEMNFNKIAPFGKEDTAKELQDHAAKTQDTLVDAVENAEVAEIKRAVFRALTRPRAARRRPSMRTTMPTTTAPRTRSATCTRTRRRWRPTSSSPSTEDMLFGTELRFCGSALHRDEPERPGRARRADAVLRRAANACVRPD